RARFAERRLVLPRARLDRRERLLEPALAGRCLFECLGRVRELVLDAAGPRAKASQLGLEALRLCRGVVMLGPVRLLAALGVSAPGELALERDRPRAERVDLAAQRGLARAGLLEEHRCARVVLDEVVVRRAELVELPPLDSELVLEGEELLLGLGQLRARPF